MLISSGIRQLENFAGVMNFVIFPMCSSPPSALYPLWQVQEGSVILYYVCLFNPFTLASSNSIRFALYGQINWISAGGCWRLRSSCFMIGAIYAYDPSRGLIRRGAAGGRHMRWRATITALLAIFASTECCFAADPRYPDWPCAQAKVPEISLAAVWAGPPLDDVLDKWKDDARVSALVSKLAARRTPLEEGQKSGSGFSGRFSVGESYDR